GQSRKFRFSRQHIRWDGADIEHLTLSLRDPARQITCFYLPPHDAILAGRFAHHIEARPFIQPADDAASTSRLGAHIQRFAIGKAHITRSAHDQMLPGTYILSSREGYRPPDTENQKEDDRPHNDLRHACFRRTQVNLKRYS